MPMTLETFKAGARQGWVRVLIFNYQVTNLSNYQIPGSKRDCLRQNENKFL